MVSERADVGENHKSEEQAEVKHSYLVSCHPSLVENVKTQIRIQFPNSTLREFDANSKYARLVNALQAQYVESRGGEVGYESVPGTQTHAQLISEVASR